MDLLTIATAGSVDDGKSTLIGRLLYETNSLKEDQLAAIERSSDRLGYDFVDWSLATDGLIAEREQGITIDVANIYFTTLQRRFIIADTPGHIEYTRNMVTGTSHANLSLILIDARNGVIEQTFRHYFITNLLRVKNIVVCINKMDLVDYSEDAFLSIVKDFKELQRKSGFTEQQVTFIPLSALHGDNLTAPSTHLPWYTGPALLEFLEKVDIGVPANKATRFQVQYVIRPKKEAFLDYRGYAGKIASGNLAIGDEVVILPSNRMSKVKRIEQYGKDITQAYAGQNITLILEDNVDVSRGDMICKSGESPAANKEISAQICWMHDKPLNSFGRYLIQHGTQRALAKLVSIQEVVNPISYERKSASTLQLNEIGTATFKTAAPLFLDSFAQNNKNGAFIIIDSDSNNTVGVGFMI